MRERPKVAELEEKSSISMSEGKIVSLAEGQAIAGRALELLSPYADPMIIAGSIRRGMLWVGDVELVCKPITYVKNPPLFDEPDLAADHDGSKLLDRLNELVDQGIMSRRTCGETQSESWGFRHQRAVFEGMALDIFGILPPSQFGAQLVIRTGPAAYSRWLVTPRAEGGAMPPGMRMESGSLWDAGVPRPTATEEEFYEAIGLSYVPPESRVEHNGHWKQIHSRFGK